MKVGLAQWTGFDAAPDTLDVAKLGDDAKKLGARYPWVLKEHKRLEAAAREAAEKKRKRLEAAAMEAVAMEAAAHGSRHDGRSRDGSRRAWKQRRMEAAPREADRGHRCGCSPAVDPGGSGCSPSRDSRGYGPAGTAAALGFNRVR